MKKKIIVLFMAALLAFAGAGCAGNKENAGAESAGSENTGNEESGQDAEDGSAEKAEGKEEAEGGGGKGVGDRKSVV